MFWSLLRRHLDCSCPRIIALGDKQLYRAREELPRAGHVSGRGEAFVSGCAVSASGCCCAAVPLVERHGLHCNILRSHVITVRGRLIPGSDECDYTLGLRWGLLAGPTKIFFREKPSGGDLGFQISVHFSNGFQTYDALTEPGGRN